MSHKHRTQNYTASYIERAKLTSSGRLRKIQPDSGWISKYLRSSRWKGAARLYRMAPLLSASSSDAETRKMLVPMFVSYECYDSKHLAYT